MFGEVGEVVWWCCGSFGGQGVGLDAGTRICERGWFLEELSFFPSTIVGCLSDTGNTKGLWDKGIFRGAVTNFRSFG